MSENDNRLPADRPGETASTRWAYQLDRGDVRIEWEDIGEGWSGDYDPEDAEDEALLRFYISRRDPDAPELYEQVEDGSFCTRVPADTDPTILQALLELIMARVYDKIVAGEPIKREAEELSWAEPGWAKLGR
jgi:hypothetical protein